MCSSDLLKIHLDLLRYNTYPFRSACCGKCKCVTKCQRSMMQSEMGLGRLAQPTDFHLNVPKCDYGRHTRYVSQNHEGKIGWKHVSVFSFLMVSRK